MPNAIARTVSPAGYPLVRRWLLLLFFLSGIAGLGYQVVWAKMLAAAVGHEFPAVLAVITAFMAGMAAGAWGFGPLRQRAGRLPLYACLEFAIGLWALVSLVLIPLLTPKVLQLIGPAPSPAWHWFIVFTFVFLVISPATAAMGATLPAIEKLTLARDGRDIPFLYAANTAGAVAGVLISIFWLMPTFGLRATVVGFASLNIVVGLAAWRFNSTSPDSEELPQKTDPSGTRRLLLVAGVLGIAFETAGIRALAHIFENTVYSFGTALSVYLAAHAAGASLWTGKLAGRARLNHLFFLLTATTITGALTLNFAPSLYQSVLNSRFPGALLVAEALVSILVFALPACAMGMLFALLACRAKASLRTWSNALAANMAGAALAPALIGLVAVPAIGLKFTIGGIAFVYALFTRGKWLVLAGGFLAAGYFIPSTSNLIQRAEGDSLVFLREGVMASVAVLQSTNSERVLKVNNRFQMGGTASRLAEERQADIPLLLHPRPRTALFIGLGTGITAATARHYPGLQATGVELVPEVAAAMPLFQEQPPNLKIRVSDGRRFAQTDTGQYDVIVADLFHPAQDGAGFLYTREHFAALKARSSQGAVVCQWLPVYQLDLELLRIIARTFQDVFQNAELWLLRFNLDAPVVGLISRPHMPPFPELQQNISAADLIQHLRKAGLADPLRLAGCFLAGPAELARWTRNAVLATDTAPIIVFRAPSITHDPSPAARSSRVIDLLENLGPSHPPPFSDAPPDFEQRLALFIAARDVYLRGVLAEMKGDRESAIAAYLESARRSSDFTAGYAQGLYLATALARDNPRLAREILLSLIAAQPDRPAASELLQRLALPNL